MATKVTSNGRVTVPKRVRDYLGIGPGTEVTFRRAADGGIVIERADGTRPPSRFAKIVGCAVLVPLRMRSWRCCAMIRNRFEAFS